MRWGWIAVMLILVLFIVGCTEGMPTTPKERAQQKLLYELTYCDNKFGSTDANLEYCGKILALVESQINNGWFDDEDDRTQRIIATQKEMLEDEDIVITSPDVEEEYKKFADEVVGEI